VGGIRLDDLGQPAADATVAVLSELDGYWGAAASPPGYKFVVFEISVKLHRHA